MTAGTHAREIDHGAVAATAVRRAYASTFSGRTVRELAQLQSDWVVGTFSFSAGLVNTSSFPLTTLAIEVNTLTNGNRLKNVDGGATGVGSILRPRQGRPTAAPAKARPGRLLSSIAVRERCCDHAVSRGS